MYKIFLILESKWITEYDAGSHLEETTAIINTLNDIHTVGYLGCGNKYFDELLKANKYKWEYTKDTRPSYDEYIKTLSELLEKKRTIIKNAKNSLIMVGTKEKAIQIIKYIAANSQYQKYDFDIVRTKK